MLTWTGIGMIAAIVIGTRLLHPELTETQLLLAFWPRWLLIVTVAGAIAAMLRRAHG
jgi:hypothetical protein